MFLIVFFCGSDNLFIFVAVLNCLRLQIYYNE
nr:MAG TPA: hypothetical protein [Crassvirales sp.]